LIDAGDQVRLAGVSQACSKQMKRNRRGRCSRKVIIFMDISAFMSKTCVTAAQK
jgi:hypothetical protein